ncbi:phosphoglycerate dehydrogenase [Heyndrickxia acidiproducens]|uniref:phosphoglycerate dehydrogenase n=1 Tax=Heyndrickxia acidiproducens TaxID=1121084 RepID=UPI000361A9AC|nr:phosphoglycerate dehydrogenase [Heyndrickxia acidiproducens]
MKKVFLAIGRSFYEAYPQIKENIESLGAEVSCLIGDYAADKQELIAGLKDADIYINGIEKVDQEIIDAAPSLKYILKYGTGVDNIDLDYATEKGISVSNAPGQNASAVAELAIGLMLSVSRKIPQSHADMQAGNWRIAMGNGLDGKRLGIIGFGSIGQNIARMASGFNMEVVASGTYRNMQAARKWEVSFTELEELLATSDYVIVSTSLKSSTYHLLDRKRLGLMKPSAYVINIARGDIIDESALLEVLQSGRIRGAALDVFSKEPTDSKLTQLPNVVVTPHIGGATEECVRMIGKMTEENIGNFLSGLPLMNLVNSPAAVRQS